MNLLVLAVLSIPAAPGSSAGGIQEGAAVEQERPNVLFIAIDDLNDWVGALGGHPRARTPNLDRLAERGVLFTNAHCPAPMCNPSRTAVLTGIPPHRSGIYDNTVPFRRVLRKAVTIPEHFRAHGYEILRAGKLHHNEKEFHSKETWDAVFPESPRYRPKDPVPAGAPLNGLEAPQFFDWGSIAVPDEAMSDAQIAEWVVARLEVEHERPFFLACGLFRPHLPWYAPESYFEPFPAESVELPEVREDDLDDVPERGRDLARRQDLHARIVEHGQWAEAVRCYLASIAFMDAQLGSVLDALDGGPNARDTIVLLWSDHGFLLGQKHHWGKETLWEEATRVPLVVVAPGATGVRPGTRSEAPVSLMDIYPTLIELCGLAPREGIDGESLVPLLREPAGARERPALTTFGWKNHALRSRRWRYIRYDDGSEELYDHDRDPHEWTNLADDPAHAGVKAELARWLPATDAPAAQPPPPSEPRWKTGPRDRRKRGG